MTKTFPYNHTTLTHVYNQLINFKKQGALTDYEIRIDDLTIVKRTNKINNFHSFKKSLHEFSMAVCILFYKGQSRKYDKYVLERQGKVSANPNITTENYIKNEVDRIVQEQKKIIDFELLKTKNKQLKKRLKRAELKNSTLENNQKNGLNEILKMLIPIIPTTGKGKIPTEINGIKTTDLINMINDKREKWGDNVFARSLGIALTIGDEPELLKEVETLISAKSKKA